VTGLSLSAGCTCAHESWFHDAIFRVGSEIFSNASTISCGFPSYRANGLEEGATGSSGEWVEQGTNKRVCT